MKKFVTVIVILASVLKIYAQQDAMVSQYMFNGLFLNPAYAGSHKYFSSSFINRMQWVGFDGAPKTSILSVDGPLLNETMGVGLILSQDKIGVTTQTDVHANYSYFLKLGTGKLGFGLKAGFSQYSSRVGDLIIWDGDDSKFAGTTTSAVLPKFGFGTYYYTQKWYAGLSIPTLIAYDPNHSFNLSLERSSAIRKHYYVTAGYVVKANENLKIIPSFLLKYQNTAPMQVDINLRGVYMDVVTLGVSYRSNDAVSVMFEYQLNKRFRAGYSYDFTTSQMKKYSFGTHEIRLGFDFGKDIIKIKTPRFF